MKRLAVTVAAVALAGFLVARLAEATMSRHRDMPAGSSTLVEGQARGRGYAEHDLRTMTHALVLTCRLEVEADVVEDSFGFVDGGRFGALLSPALDRSDERQLRGCLEDARVDSLQVEVSRIVRAR